MYSEIVQLSQKFIKSRTRKYRRYFIRQHTPTHRFTIILGEHGVGKTTTLIQYLLDLAKDDSQSTKILYVQADHFSLGQISLYEIAEQFDQLGGKTIAFDEIHKYPNWSMELKSIYDTFPNLRIFASGSSALEIYKGTHDLSRRAIVYRMLGQSLREFIELKYQIEMPTLTLEALLSKHIRHTHRITDQLAQHELKIIPIFQEYLRYGYYPYYFEDISQEEYGLILEQNIHTTIESDLAAIHPTLSGGSIKKLKQLVSYIAHSVPFIPNWSKLKTIVGVADDRTLKTYLHYLEDGGIIQSLGKGSNKLSRVESPEKIYLANPNQMYALCQEHSNLGTIRETFFLNALTLNHQLSLSKRADFSIDQKYLIEVGGKNKDTKQIKGAENAWLALDNIEHGMNQRIPLWLFGFLY